MPVAGDASRDDFPESRLVNNVHADGLFTFTLCC
jgi:hypothetical protein